MELILIVLCTSVGTLIGTCVGVLLMQRKTRPLITEEELAGVKSRLQTAESSLAVTTAALEESRKHAAESELKSQQHDEELKNKQQQLDVALAEVENEAGKRHEIEQKVQDLSLHTASLTAQRTDLENRIKEEKALVAGLASQIAYSEEQRESGKQQIQELSERVSRLTEASAAVRSSLEAQIEELTGQIAKLESERSDFDGRLEAERRSAAKGMELLLMAQENLARVFQPLGADLPNGENGHAAAQAVAG
jgi:chromosome segregation ATPase